MVWIQAAFHPLSAFHTERSVSEEKTAYEDVGYNLSDLVPFIIGFDEVYNYDERNNTAWKIYIKEGKVVYIIFTKYGFLEDNKITVYGKVKYEDTYDLLVQKMGEPLVIQALWHQLCYYPEEGISFVVDDGLVKCFNLFAPMPAKDASGRRTWEIGKRHD